MNKHLTILCLLYLLCFYFFIALVPTQAETLKGKVVRVLDGDTVVVLVGARQIKVRLYGIDAPESKQPYGLKAKQYVLMWVKDKIIELTILTADRYNRSIGKICQGKICLHEELVREGLAWWYKQYATKDIILENLEGIAKRMHKGLWSDKSSIAPWVYRKRK